MRWTKLQEFAARILRMFSAKSY